MQTRHTADEAFERVNEDSTPDCFLRIADKLVCLVMMRHRLLPLAALQPFAAAA